MNHVRHCVMLVKWLHFHPCAVSEPDCNCYLINILRGPEISLYFGSKNT